MEILDLQEKLDSQAHQGVVAQKELKGQEVWMGILQLGIIQIIVIPILHRDLKLHIMD